MKIPFCVWGVVPVVLAGLPVTMWPESRWAWLFIAAQLLLLAAQLVSLVRFIRS